jgi:hypothetical protein
MVQGQPGQIVLEIPSPKQPEQNGLEVWLNRTPSLQKQSPEFKPQSHQKTTEKTDINIFLLNNCLSDWKFGSGSGVPALQVLNPEFKL